MLARDDNTVALRLRPIEARALAIAAAIAAKRGPYSAGVVPGATALWHLVETLPGAERKAMRYLAKRGFGVFLPAFDADSLAALRVLGFNDARALIFPGHVLLFVWDVLAHWRRIGACPGVKRVVCNEHEVPVTLMDDTVDQLRGLQSAFRLASAGKRARAGWRRRRLSEQARAVAGDKALRALDGATRNQALRRALGLGS